MPAPLTSQLIEHNTDSLTEQLTDDGPASDATSSDEDEDNTEQPTSDRLASDVVSSDEDA